MESCGQVTALTLQCSPPIQGLRARSRCRIREVCQHRHPTPSEGWWSRLAALRSPTGHRQGYRRVSPCLSVIHSIHQTDVQFLRQERGRRFRSRTQKDPHCLRPIPPCCRPPKDGAQEVRWTWCPSKATKSES
jgi:hypothetical protein